MSGCLGSALDLVSATVTNDSAVPTSSISYVVVCDSIALLLLQNPKFYASYNGLVSMVWLCRVWVFQFLQLFSGEYLVQY